MSNAFQVSIFMRHEQMLVDKALEAERRKMQAMISKALADGDMDAAATAELIRKIKADFEENRQLTCGVFISSVNDPNRSRVFL